MSKFNNLFEKLSNKKILNEISSLGVYYDDFSEMPKNYQKIWMKYVGNDTDDSYSLQDILKYGKVNIKILSDTTENSILIVNDKPYALMKFGGAGFYTTKILNNNLTEDVIESFVESLIE
jgi:hypothetical protein